MKKLPGHAAPVALAFAVLLGACTPSGRAESNARPLLADRIDETRLVTLSGNTRSTARDERNDRGLVEDSLQMDHMLLLLRRPDEKEAELRSLLDAMHTPGSPEFHHWLSPEEFGERFGVAATDRDIVTTWLASHGFAVQRVYENGTMIDFSGNAAQVREAFHTELHILNVNGEAHVSNTADPRIPAALAPAIQGIVSLNDFRPHPLHRDVMSAHIDPESGKLLIAGAGEPRAATADYSFNISNSTYQAVTPGDLATIYNLNRLFSAGYSGQGQTIAVIEDSNVYATADWTMFRSTFGLSKFAAGSFSQVHPGNCTNPGVNASDSEAILDAEYASAAAPSAAIQVVSCAGTRATFGGLIALENFVNTSKALPAVVSISYGECEAENGAAANASYSAAYQQATAEGISVFVASGDEGAAGCDAGAVSAAHGINVSGVASTAYNVAVGGTDFGDTYSGTNTTYWNPTSSASYASARSYINEIPWNDSCASILLATAATRSALTYGSQGFCNTATGAAYYLNAVAASGGPSGCYSGTAHVTGVISGSCRGTAKPYWQAGLPGVPADGVRDLPDVSLFAGNGAWGHYYVYCYSDVARGGKPCTSSPSGWSGGGGTSFAAPIMAGIQAIVNQKAGGRQGNPNVVYYKLAAKEYGTAGSAACNSSHGNQAASTCTFYDVTEGDVDVTCTGTANCYKPSGLHGVLSTSTSAYKPAYGTSTGYDFASGIGTVNAFNLVSNWSLATTEAKPFTLKRAPR